MPRFPFFMLAKPLPARHDAVARAPRPFGYAPAPASGTPCGDTAMVVASLEASIRLAYGGHLRPRRQTDTLPDGEPCDGCDADAWVRYVREIARLTVSPPTLGDWYLPKGRCRRRRGEAFSPSELPSPVGAPAHSARMAVAGRTTLDRKTAACVDLVVASGQVRIRGPPTATVSAPGPVGRIGGQVATSGRHPMIALDRERTHNSPSRRRDGPPIPDGSAKYADDRFFRLGHPEERGQSLPSASSLRVRISVDSSAAL